MMGRGDADGVRCVGRPVWRRFVIGVAALCACRVKRARDVTVVPSIGCCARALKQGKKKSNAEKISKKLEPSSVAHCKCVVDTWHCPTLCDAYCWSLCRASRGVEWSGERAEQDRSTQFFQKKNKNNLFY